MQVDQGHSSKALDSQGGREGWQDPGPERVFLGGVGGGQLSVQTGLTAGAQGPGSRLLLVYPGALDPKFP